MRAMDEYSTVDPYNPMVTQFFLGATVPLRKQTVQILKQEYCLSTIADNANIETGILSLHNSRQCKY